MSPDPLHRGSHRAAFSIIEYVGVALLCSAIAAMALPRWVRHRECSRTVAAFAYLQHLSHLQRQHFDQFGCYETDPMKLDLALVVPASFAIDVKSVSDEHDSSPTWSASLVRQGSAFGFGDYRITFDQAGYAPERSSINTSLLPLGFSTMHHRDIR